MQFSLFPELQENNFLVSEEIENVCSFPLVNYCETKIFPLMLSNQVFYLGSHDIYKKNKNYIISIERNNFKGAIRLSIEKVKTRKNLAPTF